MDRRLIDHFVNANLLSRQDMQRAILRASKDKTGVVTQLLDAGLIGDELLAGQIAEFYQHELVDLVNFRVDPSALRMITEGIATKAGAIPYAYDRGSGSLMVATFDPDRAKDVLEMLASATGQPPIVAIAPRGWLEQMIPYSYQQSINEASGFGRESRGGSKSSFQDRPNSAGRNAFGDRPKSGISRIRRKRGDVSRPNISNSAKLADALDDFDDFLKDEEPAAVLSPRSSFAGRPASLPPIDEPPPRARNKRKNKSDNAFDNLGGDGAFWEEDVNTDKRWGWDELSGTQQAPAGKEPISRSSSDKPNNSGFDLFEQTEKPPSSSMTLQEIVEMHNRKINSLRDEAQRQREVIQALADLLVENRVISRRELSRRLKELRKGE